ncbi:MAG: M23 family metallopeptidase, partial [Myxococcales bacterium]|nr:M23 family metallopeptidase [Myxococcales bacterium]
MALILALTAFAQDYAFPTSQAHRQHFYPTAYYDHGGVQDWNCSNDSYAGHRGSDFGVGGFTGMDAGREVRAAADGVVVTAHDGEFDRCTTGSCAGGGGFGNYVSIDHADGRRTYYGHLKLGSVLVSAGDTVTCGQQLGEVGSSGNSTGPHLHFEVRVANVAVDPFEGSCNLVPSAWVDQGVYGGTPEITCGPPPVCDNSDTLACGQVLADANGGAGSTDVLGSYGCTTFTYTGPEIAYTLVPGSTGDVTVDLTGLSADLDLFAESDDTCEG